jgi:hypothetical protein
MDGPALFQAGIVRTQPLRHASDPLGVPDRPCVGVEGATFLVVADYARRKVPEKGATHNFLSEKGATHKFLWLLDKRLHAWHV